MSRATKSGIGYDIEKKMEHSYDQLEQEGTPEAIKAWIESVLEEKCLTSSGQHDLHCCLKDGVVLCKLINTLLAKQGKKAVGFKKNANNAFAAMGNIESFNKGCLEYGMVKEALFQSTDLYEGRKGPFVNIINTLHSLGMTANAQGCETYYTGQQERFLEDN